MQELKSHKKIVLTGLVFTIFNIYYAGQPTEEDITKWFNAAKYEAKLPDISDIDVNMQDEKGNTALIYASGNFWDKNIVQELLQQPNIRVNIHNNEGETALMAAASQGNENTARLLLKVPNININAQDQSGRTALIHAALNGREDIVKILLQVLNININAQDQKGRTAFNHAVLNGRDNVVKLLLHVPGIDINSYDKSGFTPLMHAIFAKNENMVNILSEAPEININAQTKDGNTALMFAAESGQENIVKLLLFADADVALTNSQGLTALDLARKFNHHAIVKLIEDMLLVNKKEKLMQAAKMRESDFDKASSMIKLLRDVGVDINDQDGYGNTPLIYAAANNNEKLVRFLISFGANPKIRNRHNETAADIAQTAGHEKLATYLKLRAI